MNYQPKINDNLVEECFDSKSENWSQEFYYFFLRHQAIKNLKYRLKKLRLK